LIGRLLGVWEIGVLTGGGGTPKKYHWRSIGSRPKWRLVI